MTSADSLVMTTIHVGLVALLCGSACLVPDDAASDVSTPGEGAHIVVTAGMDADDDDVCALLPACGPCSVACDAAALADYIPPGTCAAFVCELTDGRRMTFHACHPE